MKHFVSLFMLSMLAVLTLGSCSVFQADNAASYFPFKESKSDDWGLISSKGKVLIADEYKEEPTVVTNDRFFVKNKKDMWEIYTADEKPLQVGDQYEQACLFQDGLAPVLRKGKKNIDVINTDGEIVFTLSKIKGKQVTMVYPFNEGYAVFCIDNEKYGVIDKKGNIVIEPNYYAMSVSVTEGEVVAIEYKDKDKEPTAQKLYILDMKGNEINKLSKTKYDAQGFFIDGLMPYSTEDNTWGILDKEGNVVVKASAKIHSITNLRGDKFVYTDEEGNYGLMNKQGEVLIKPKFAGLFFMDDDILMAQKDDKYYLVDAKGEKIGTEKYEGAYMPFFNGGSIVKTGDNSYGFIGKDGNIIKDSPEIYDFDFKTPNSYVSTTQPNVDIQYDVDEYGDSTEVADYDSVSCDVDSAVYESDY